ncbi:MAG: tRNA (adenosine(37)-N6)-threonylcarbamoyltransferase complex ATPase subunit type 1 TsaE [Clostridiales bacterium]|nr:tRNA (adenosine(37)-N6)-threonylcarbamoyltransferase complex ATPase subunit type 1 TsaE [Clostridiales bacterium]
MSLETISTSVEMTERLGEAIGKVVCAGDLITLDGDLGAGKTAFTRGLARGMGLSCRVTSPTFTIVNEYNDQQGVPRLFHFDTYRLSNSDDFYDAGLDEYFGRDGVCVIEWSTVIEDALAKERIRLLISGNGETRTIRILYSEKYASAMQTVRAEMEKEGMHFADISM